MRRFIFLPLIGLLAACASAPPAVHYGAYRLEDGRIVSLRRSTDEAMRYRIYPTGESGRLYPAGDGSWVSGTGFSAREPVALHVEFTADGEISWQPVGDETTTASRFLQIEAVEFESDGATLRGQLSLPPGDGPFPAVALVHGSGSQSALEYFYTGDFLAANGVAALVYDKRGSGSSGGDFTFDFRQLARDAVAAVAKLSDHPKIDSSRLGLCGYSQGAWVAPLAASMDDRIRFVSVAYGMIESPMDEAIWESQDLLRSRGVDDAGIEEATPLIQAATGVVAGGFSSGWEEFEAAKRATEGAAWRDEFGGNPIERMLRYPKWLIKLIGPRMAPKGLDWSYSSDAVLGELEIPMTWLLAGEDKSAPNQATIPKLRAYAGAGKPFELIVFEGADHSMLMFEEKDDVRSYTGYAPGYFEAEVENVLRMSRVP